MFEKDLIRSMASPDHEAAFLGCIILQGDDPRAIEAVNSMNINMFTVDVHKVIFKALETLALQGEMLDELSVIKELGRLCLWHAVGVDKMRELKSFIRTLDSIDPVIKLLQEKYKARKLLNLSDGIKTELNSYGDVSFSNILNNVNEKISLINMEIQTQEPLFVRDHVKILLENIAKKSSEKGLPGVVTGFKSLDSLTLGWQPSTLNIIAARPGMGKTAIALRMAYAAARENIPSIFFSMEMSNYQLNSRLLSFISGVRLKNILDSSLTHDESALVNNTYKEILKLPIIMDFQSNRYISDIIAISRQMKRKYGIKIIFIDYLQLLRLKDRYNSTFDNLTEISATLKMLAKDLDVPVVCLAQLNRQPENRADKRPELSDLRGSGCIEQDADIVSFLWHDPQEPPQNMSLLIRKHRNGPTGEIALRYIAEQTYFMER